ncbi:hypothetical protein CBR_g12691 [Chara braunii]|uniref:Protein farnesyltransferase subunit beta n=1 Tax=Chara braunii TaxID=69332 RepID=A0A388KSI4_CHABU|nr:hypothetical protein CBR_g12691 [Chara braunii]|eukprot:GBG72972.1 hypothetical protein CBR_g12691 [Chara braunii]
MRRRRKLLSQTTIQQKKVEKVIGKIYGDFLERSVSCDDVILYREQHVKFLLKGLHHLSSKHTSMDASRTWLCYWITHSLALLGEWLDPQLADRCLDYLYRCQDPDGGFGGGPGQLPHLATSYAAVCTLVTIGGRKALSTVDRKKMLEFLMRMKTPSGGFRMHENGEVDMRGCYTALAVAHMLNITTPELKSNVAEYISSCQTYEGGIGGEPGNEAHGGYTFCGFAALMLADAVHAVDLPSLVDWVVFRQGAVEGGFQGRTNKLVDGCYSYWQGTLFLLLQRVIHQPLADQRVNKPSGLDVKMEPPLVFETPCGSPNIPMESELGTDVNVDSMQGLGEQSCSSREEEDVQLTMDEAGGKGKRAVEEEEEERGGEREALGDDEKTRKGCGTLIVEEEEGGSSATMRDVGDGQGDKDKDLPEMGSYEEEESAWVQKTTPSEEEVDYDGETWMDDSDIEEARRRRFNAIPLVKAEDLFASYHGFDRLAEGGCWLGGDECVWGEASLDEVDGKDVLQRPEKVQGTFDTDGGNDRGKFEEETEESEANASCQVDRNGNGTGGVSGAGGQMDGEGLGADVFSIALFNTRALQGYVLICCQATDGGLKDRPGKAPVQCSPSKVQGVTGVLQIAASSSITARIEWSDSPPLEGVAVE